MEIFKELPEEKQSKGRPRRDLGHNVVPDKDRRFTPERSRVFYGSKIKTNEKTRVKFSLRYKIRPSLDHLES